jgi:hypothetical protein
MLLQAVIGVRLEALEDFSIGSLDLPITLWMSNGHITDLDVKILAVSSERAAGELGTVINDDPIRDPKPTDDELDCRLLVNLDHMGCFRALGELVDGDVQIPKSSDGTRNGPRMSSPHMANDHEGGIICSVCVSVWIHLAWNWHASHLFTSSSVSCWAVGQ